MDDNKHWFAAYTKSRHEKSVNDRLQQKNITTFLPLIKEKKQWKDRKKLVETPLIKSYIFVNIEHKNLLYVLQTHGVVNIVKIGNQYTKIPDYQIDALQKALEEKLTLTPVKCYSAGEMVKVKYGPLQGKIGRIINISGNSKLLLSIDAINYAFSTPIEPENVEKLPKNCERND